MNSSLASHIIQRGEKNLTRVTRPLATTCVKELNSDLLLVKLGLRSLSNFVTSQFVDLEAVQYRCEHIPHSVK